MAYQNFIPTVWAEAINRELEKRSYMQRAATASMRAK